MATTDSGRRTRDHLQVVDDRPLWARLTGRAVVLILVAAALVMSLAFPIREYLAQRAAIAAAEQRAAMLEERVEGLQGQVDRWRDDDFVEQQARERLHYVMPGETGPGAAVSGGRRGGSQAGDPDDGRARGRVVRHAVGVGAGSGQPVSAADSAAVSETDRAAVRRQLGREPRGMVAVAHRCACGEPDVVTTAPRLPDGTPFPTVYYLTCPRMTSAVSTLEAEGRMRQMQDRLADDADAPRALPPCPRAVPR